MEETAVIDQSRQDKTTACCEYESRKLSSLHSVESIETIDSTLPSPPVSPVSERRAIFQTFWKKVSSGSIRDDHDNDNTFITDSPIRRSGSSKIAPSYLGIYSFAPPSPLVSPKQELSHIGSSDGKLLSPCPTLPKSILRRHHSDRRVRHTTDDEGTSTRSRSVTMGSPDEASPLKIPFSPQLPFKHLLFQDSQSTHTEEDDGRSTASNGSSRTANTDSRNHTVHFDPTITVREVVGGTQTQDGDLQSNWFNDKELNSFFREAVNLCHSSTINSIKVRDTVLTSLTAAYLSMSQPYSQTYSPPEVAKANAMATKAGINDHIVSSSLPENRALFAEPILHVTDEDAIVHAGSKAFFRVSLRMVRKVLIVDNSHCTLKLFKRHVLSMFPHARVDLVTSGEDALRLMEVGPSGNVLSHRYDIVIVEEHLSNQSEGSERNDEEDSKYKKSRAPVTGSQLLRCIDDSESKYGEVFGHTLSLSEPQQQTTSLKIGVSTNLSEDCESLRKGGADFLWSKPPPMPSYSLRDQMLNTLLIKRGKSIFICGC